MTNHFHLLLMPTRQPLSLLMRRLLTSYAVFFNRRHARAGHLFQNRYKSIVCEEEPYLFELVRYIHLNPLRAGLVADLATLDRYPWSGHAVLMGHQAFEGQDITEVLARFGRAPAKARQQYRQFVEDGIPAGGGVMSWWGVACDEAKGRSMPGLRASMNGSWEAGRLSMVCARRALSGIGRLKKYSSGC
jgi:hypothetical protein